MSHVLPFSSLKLYKAEFKHGSTGTRKRGAKRIEKRLTERSGREREEGQEGNM